MFAFLTQRLGNNDDKILNTIDQFNNRINKVQGSQFFSGWAQYVKLSELKGLIIVDFNIHFMPVHYIFLLGGLISLVLKVWTGVIVCGVLFALLYFLRTKYFYALLFKKSLRKNYYTDKARLL